MKRLTKQLCFFAALTLGLFSDSFSAGLSGTVNVNQTSDTAANAKINAMNSARRQILFSVLSRYSKDEDLTELLQNTSSDELMDLISSVSVSNEKIATDTYSAKVTMNIDNDIAKKWLDKNGVQNWVPSMVSDEKFTVFIVVQNGIVDWAELKRITRYENVDIETQSMTGNQVVAKMPLSYRTKFTAAVREAGWKYTDNDGVLQIWK